MPKKTLEDFTYLFLATCFLEESRHLNLDLFKEYIYLSLSREDYDVPNDFALIDKKINLIISQMLNDKLVKEINGFDYLIAISNQDAFTFIIENNKEEIAKMSKIYEEYINFAFHSEKEIYQVLSQKEGNNNIVKKLS